MSEAQDKNRLLERQLWELANMIRGDVPAGDVPLFVIGLVYLRYVFQISQTTEDEQVWSILTDQRDISGFLRLLREQVGQYQVLDEVLENLGLLDWLSGTHPGQLHQVVSILGEMDTSDFPLPGLADALSGIFERAKRGSSSEFYTADTVSTLMAQLAQPEGVAEIYDPTCGTGRLLLNAFRATQNGRTRIFGQDVDARSVAIARLLLELGGAQDAHIAMGDTLTDPQFLNPNGSVRQFNCIVSALPLNMQMTPRQLQVTTDDPRFIYGTTRGTADMMFIQHILASLSPTGRAVVLTTRAILFREDAKSDIRKRIVEDDLVEAVISLPANVLLDTSAPPALIVFNRAKPTELRRKILFVDATEEYMEHHRRHIITDASRDKIVDVVLRRTAIEGFSQHVTSEEVAGKNYILMPSTYIASPLGLPSGFLLRSEKAIRLEEISEIMQGTRKAGRDSIQKGQGNIAVIQGRNISSYSISPDDLERISVVGELRNEVYAGPGDILVQRIGEAPSAYLVEEHLEGTLVWDTVYVVRLHSEFEYLRYYVLEYLNSPVWYHKLNSLSSGIGAQTMRLATLRQAEIPLPDANVIAPLQELYRVERDMQARLNRLRDLKENLFAIEDENELRDQLQEISVRERIVVQTTEQAHDFDYQLRNLYPYVLAYPYRVLSSITQDAALYPEQLRIGENIAALLGSIGMAFLMSQQSHEGNLSGGALDQAQVVTWWQRGVSPGDWETMAKTCAGHMRHSDVRALSEFSAVWYRGRGQKSSSFAANLHLLLELLNDNKHGRGPTTNRALGAKIQQADELLRGCLADLAFLTQYPIHLVEKLDFDWQTRQHLAQTLVHMGDHPGFRKAERILSQPLSVGKLYMEAAEDLWIPLYPLMAVEECPVCQNREVYAIDRWDGFDGRLILKSFARGHTISTRDNNDFAQVAIGLRKDFEYFIQGLTGHNTD